MPVCSWKEQRACLLNSTVSSTKAKTSKLGWNVNLKILEPLERALDWAEEEER